MLPTVMPRYLAAAAVGLFADLFGIGDAYAYHARMRGLHSAALWCALAALLIVPAILNFGSKLTLRLAAAILAGMAVPHTLVLIREISVDPTSHNLWPFEYILLGLFVVPALLGGAAGRFAGQAWAAGNRGKV